MMINMLIQLIFCLGLFPGSIFSFRNDLVKTVESKIHCAHHNIHTLQQNMLMGIHLRNILRRDYKPIVMQRFRESAQKFFEFLPLPMLVWQSIQIDDQPNRQLLLRNVGQAKGML